jgi:hypothetical protein
MPFILLCRANDRLKYQWVFQTGGVTPMRLFDASSEPGILPRLICEAIAVFAAFFAVLLLCAVGGSVLLAAAEGQPVTPAWLSGELKFFLKRTVFPFALLATVLWWRRRTKGIRKTQDQSGLPVSKR